jgi:hypothetical protein
MIKDLGHWEYNGEIPDDCFGFIYEITNNKTNRKYIGKKQMQKRIKRKPLKGKKRNRICWLESDWKTYTGSCRELNEEIEQYGKEHFTFEILKLCCSKSDLAYNEIKLQLEKDVLLREEYFNGIINCRLGKVKLS